MNNALIFLLVVIPAVLIFWGYVFKTMARDDAETRKWITKLLRGDDQ